MNHKEFEEMVERLRANTKSFSNVKSETTEEGTDRVTFDWTYVSLQQMGKITKTLRIARFPEAFPDGTPLPAMIAGKITVCELKKCSECGSEIVKNVTAEIGAIMNGVVPQGW